jgi:hypothetical protein
LDRFTGKRLEKALNVTLNSVVFRSSGQDLTTAGTYIEMTSRLVESALLALAVLAVRGRIENAEHDGNQFGAAGPVQPLAGRGGAVTSGPLGLPADPDRRGAAFVWASSSRGA